VNKLLRVPNTSSPIGVRDRAMLELLYSSGLRAGELCKLTVYDLDFETRIVRILEGKGRKDRLVPVGRTALDWCKKYLKDVRPVLLPRNQGNAAKLFLTLFGGEMKTAYLSAMPVLPKCSKVEPQSGTSKRCLDMPTSAPHKFTPTLPKPTCKRSTRRPHRANAGKTKQLPPSS